MRSMREVKGLMRNRAGDNRSWDLRSISCCRTLSKSSLSRRYVAPAPPLLHPIACPPSHPSSPSQLPTSNVRRQTVILLLQIQTTH